MSLYQTVPKIIIEGSIGAGKTTILKYIHEKYGDFIIVPEPVEYWMKTGFFSKYNTDSKKYGFQFQLLAMISRFIENKKGFDKSMKTFYKMGPLKGKHPPVVLERSGAADYNCFMKYMKTHEELNEDQVFLLDLYYDHYFNAFNVLSKETSTFIILNTNPEVCYDRVVKRNRDSEEKKVKVKYLEELHQLHMNDLIKDLKSRNLEEGKSYFIVDNNKKIEDVKAKIDEIINKVLINVKKL